MSPARPQNRKASFSKIRFAFEEGSPSDFYLMCVLNGHLLGPGSEDQLLSFADLRKIKILLREDGAGFCQNVMCVKVISTLMLKTLINFVYSKHPGQTFPENCIFAFIFPKARGSRANRLIVRFPAEF